MSPRWERTRRIAQIALLAALAWDLVEGFRAGTDRNAHVHELYGAWAVDRFVVDGVERPPLLTDPERWRVVGANPTKLVIHPMTGARELLSLLVDPVGHVLTVAPDEAEHGEGKEEWRYARPAPDRLTIDAVHRGKHLQVWMHLKPEAPLLARGFHWINEEPTSEARFNR
jgi:hypothetical protein